MATRLSLSYDREGDILYLDAVAPHERQHSDEVGDVVIRTNADTGRVENIEIIGFASHFRALGDSFELPVSADLQLLDDECPD